MADEMTFIVSIFVRHATPGMSARKRSMDPRGRFRISESFLPLRIACERGPLLSDLQLPYPLQRRLALQVRSKSQNGRVMRMIFA